jgi:hypothetical protein
MKKKDREENRQKDQRRKKIEWQQSKTSKW